MRKLVLPALLVAVATASALVGATSVSWAQSEVVIDDLSKMELVVGTAGHVKLNDGGLKITTDDTTARAKAAGFITVDATLTQVAGFSADPSMKFNPTPPSTAVPGFQLKVSSPSKGSWILVGEPGVYGNKWWASKAGCASCVSLNIPWSAGGGSEYSATLDEWAAGVPDAKVTAIGFSLGSSVKGEGVLKSLKFGDTTYRFAGAPEVPPTTTPPTTTPEPTDEPEPPADDNDSDNGGNETPPASDDNGSNVDDGLNPGPLVPSVVDSVVTPVGDVETGGGPA